ncbi:hypothetical protein NUACC26_021060 [Scytonema sp. NUACC26]
MKREWLYWYEEHQQRYLTPSEQVKIAEQQAQAEAQRAEKLAAKLRELNIDPVNSCYNRCKSRCYNSIFAVRALSSQIKD